MDVDERLSTILQECTWVSDPGTAVRLIPALASEAPAFVRLPRPDGDVRAAVPVVCVPMVADAVARTVVGAVNGELASLEDADSAEVAADPLAAACAEMFAQCARPGLRSQTVPALVVAWCVWEILGGRGANLPGMEDASGRASKTAAARLMATQGTARAEMLQRVGWAIAARVAGGLSLASMSGASIATGGLYRQILPHPLVLGFPRGTLDRNPAEAALVLGLSLEPGLVEAGRQAAAWLLGESRKRLAAGNEEPLDVALQAAVPEGLAPESAALHPVAGPALVAALPGLGDSKELVRAGLDKKYVKGLLSARGARAMTAAWRTLCHGLGVWDVLSSLVARVAPLHDHGGRLVGPDGVLPADARWPMLLPRPKAAETLQAVVAVRITEVRESLQGALVKRPWSLRNVERTFIEVARKNGASVRMVAGDHAICTFPAPEIALRFALVVRRALGPEAAIALGDDSSTIPVPPTASLGVGLSLGVVDGGCDGEASWLTGRAVAEAVALAGNGRSTRIFDDGVGVRSAGWSSDGMSNESVVATGAFVRSILDRTRRRNRPVYVRGEGGSCGGISEDFALAPVAGWWEAGDGVVAAALLLDKDSGEGAAELRVMRAEDLREWFASDRSAAFQHQSAARAAARAPAPGPLTRGDDDEPTGLEGPSLSFMGQESLPGQRSLQPDDSLIASDPAAGTGPEGFGFVVEDAADDAANDLGSFSLNGPKDAPRPPAPVAAPMVLEDEGSAPAAAAPPRMAAPMLLPDEETHRADSSGPSAPMMLEDDEPVRASGAPSAPMMLEDDEPVRVTHAPSAPMTLEDDEPVRVTHAPSAPMMLEDDEPVRVSHAPSAPMMLEDDEPARPSAPMMLEPDEPAGGLLGEVQDPFGDELSDPGVGLEAADSVFGPGPSRAVGKGDPSHSTYQGEMELVGVAGFSLNAGESTQGLDPMHDPDDTTGFFDERVSAHPRRVRSTQQPRSTARAPDGAMVRELVRLLRGYVVIQDGGTTTFGLPDGGLLRDAWSHEGGLHEAYVGFLQSKVADGFIPRADRVVALVRDVKPQPIDPAAIEQAANQAGL